MNTTPTHVNHTFRPIFDRNSRNKSTNFLTLKEVCQELSISIATGRNWIKSGRLLPEDKPDTDVSDNAKPVFSKESIQQLKETLQSGGDTVLKSRRNKNYISGNQFYDAYLPEHSPNIPKVKELLKNIESYGYPTDETGIRVLLADCALKLFHQQNFNYVNHTDSLSTYMEQKSANHPYNPFLDALLKDHKQTKTLLRKYPEIFSIEYTYVPKEDLLGLLYLSLRNLGNRKSNGAYYTPQNVVQQLLDDLPVSGKNKSNAHEEKDLVHKTLSNEDERRHLPTLLDPCCGTGNFLLQLSDKWRLEQLYAYDIDEISVAVTRINLALKFPEADTELICNHVQCKDFLLNHETTRYNYIIGNPPWGFAYSENEKEILRQNFVCAGKTPESYDLFMENALNRLTDKGILSFVIPEAILNVRSHKAVRQLICDSCNIETLTYLGNIFDGVWCPSVIIQLKKTNHPISVKGAHITDAQRHFIIEKERPVTAKNFHLAVTDEEYALLQKIEVLKSAVTLKGNADFALGIVTGNNKQYLIPAEETEKNNLQESPNQPDNTWHIMKGQPTYTSKLEPVLKGSDIEAYHINPTKYYIDFQPEQFQQCAPVELYRAPEKLVYRFIGQKLVFAYDNRQHISLNSCNILIPHLDGLDMKYVLTILNSGIARFFVQKKWNSLKVLRSHLEQIPIPVISKEEQTYFIEMADKLMNMTTKASLNKHSQADSVTAFHQLYDKLDKTIAKLYGLTEEEYQLIRESV